MNILLIFLIIISVFKCNSGKKEFDNNSFEYRIAIKKIDSCIGKQCVNQNKEKQILFKGFDDCVSSTCELKFNNFQNYILCNENCLNPFVNKIPEQDRQTINQYNTCRLQCIEKEIQSLQNQEDQNEGKESTDNLRFQAIFISICIFVFLAIGIALYIWCSIYHRRRQEIIIVPGQINSQIQNQQQQQIQNQEILQSRITDPDKIFVIEGSTILHQNQKIIPKFELNLSRKLLQGTYVTGLPCTNATLLDITAQTYNNMSMVELNNDNSNIINNNQNNSTYNNQIIFQNNDLNNNINNLNDNYTVINFNQTHQSLNINQSPIQNQNRILNINNNNENYIHQSIQVNQDPLSQTLLTEDNSPQIAYNRQIQIIPIHDVYIPQINKDECTKNIFLQPDINTDSNTHNKSYQIQIQKCPQNILNTLDLLVQTSSNSKNNLQIKSSHGNDQRNSQKQSSKKSSKRNSVLADLQNRPSNQQTQNSQLSQLQVFSCEYQEKQNNKQEVDEYEYYYETGSSNDSSDTEDAKKENQNNNNNTKVKNSQTYKTEELGKSQICLEISANQQDDFNLKIEEKHKEIEIKNQEEVEANNFIMNKCNGSTDETVPQGLSTSQNFGKQSNFSLRCYSAEKLRYQDDFNDKLNESQKIIIKKLDYSMTESPSYYLNHSQTLSPDIFSHIKQSPQKLLLKACDEINIMSQEIRKKSSSVDMSAKKYNQEINKEQLNLKL